MTALTQVIYPSGSYVNIRSVSTADTEDLKHIIESTALFPSQMLDDMIAGYLTGKSDCDRWIIIDDGRPKGLAYYTRERMTEGTWNLLLIAIRAEDQRKGFGKKLVRFIENQLFEEKQRILIVETSGLSQFENTRHFYERSGFFREAVIKNFYQDGEDKIIFTKSIALK